MRFHFDFLQPAVERERNLYRLRVGMSGHCFCHQLLPNRRFFSNLLGHRPLKGALQQHANDMFLVVLRSMQITDRLCGAPRHLTRAR